MRPLPDSLVRELLEWQGDFWFYPFRFACSPEESFEGMRILDAGCRFGRMAVYFALLGVDVVGALT